MSWCPSPDELAASARGELETAVELHIDGCSACRLALSEACRRAATESRAPSLPDEGDVVGRYAIGSRLGEGAMGVVFAAHDRELAREVAIKLLRPQPGVSEDVIVRERMLREGRAIARIDHPNVVRVLDVGEWRGERFVVMERLSGVTLRAWLATRPSPTAIRDILVQCARGLAAAHGVDVVHRDFKPDNVLVEADGHARVADFGLAASTGAAGGELDESYEPFSPRLTRTHGALGTPAYMAPEQRRGEPVDARADQYAWCVVAVEALPLAAWPRRARKALRRGLEKAPDERWRSIAELLAFATPRRGPGWILGASLVLAAAIAIVGSRHADDDRCDLALGWTGPREGRAAMTFSTNPSAWRYIDGAAARYATSWRTLRLGACRDHQPAIAHCLDRRRDELSALVDRWQPGAKTALELAPQAIDALVPVENCRAPEAAEPVDHPELATAFAAARAERLTGHSDHARAGFVELLRADDPALRAQVLVELATTERDLGDTAGSRKHLVQAIAAAELAGASRTKVVAWGALAEISTQDLIDLAEAHDAIELATAVVERLGRPSDLVHGLELERGLLLIREGHPSEALVALDHSLTLDVQPTERAHRLFAIARAQLDMGSFVEGLACLARADRTLTDAMGSNAPGRLAIENTMIDPLRMLGRYDEAIAHGEHILASDPTSRFRRRVLNNLASAYADAGKLDRALAIQTELAATATTDYDRALFETNLGSTLTLVHRDTEALAHLERGRALLGKLFGADHVLVGNSEFLLALLEIDQFHPDRALPHARQALAIREHTHAEPGYVAEAKNLVAELLVETGKRSEGLALARTILTDLHGVPDKQLELTRRLLARETRR